jgi:hypothetical protein
MRTSTSTSSSVPAADSEAGSDAGCEPILRAERVVPTVVLLVERATSMFSSALPNGGSGPFGDSRDPWEATRSAVYALQPIAGEVALSLMTYHAFKEGTDQCPIVPQIGTAPAPITENPTQFLDIMAEMPPSEDAIPAKHADSPMGAAIEAVVEAVEGFGKSGPRHVVVFTVGKPDTCVNFDPQCGMDVAIGKTQAAFDAGITLHFFSIGDADRFVEDLAHAGQGLPVAPPLSDDLFCIQSEPKPGEAFDYDDWRPAAFGRYGVDGLEYDAHLAFVPTDTEELTADLGQLVSGLRTCAFDLARGVKRSAVALGTVELLVENAPVDLVPYDEDNGWVLDDESDRRVLLKGDACDRLLTSNSPSIRVAVPCDAQIQED